MLDLPVELIERIGYECSRAYPWPISIIPLMCTCKTLARILRPLVFRNIFIEGQECSLSFTGFMKKYPHRAKDIRSLDINEWFSASSTEYNKQIRTVEEVALVIALADQLRLLSISADEYALHLTKTLPLALVQCRNLVRLELYQVLANDETVDDNTLEPLRYIQAPLEEFAMTGFVRLPFHIFDILRSFSTTLKSLRVADGSIGEYDLQGQRCPQMSLLDLENVDCHLKTIEDAFPNLKTLISIYQEEPSIPRRSNQDHTLSSWRLLERVDVDTGSLLMLGLRGCSIRRLKLSVGSPEFTWDATKPYIQTFIRSSSPQYLSIDSPYGVELATEAIAEIFERIHPSLSRLYNLDWTLVVHRSARKRLPAILDKLRGLLPEMSCLQSLHLRFVLKSSSKPSGNLTKKAVALETDAIYGLLAIVMRITPALNLLAIHCLQLSIAIAARRSQTQGSSHTIEDMNYVQACTQLEKPWVGWDHNDI